MYCSGSPGRGGCVAAHGHGQAVLGLARQAELAPDHPVGAVRTDDDPGPEPAVEHDHVVGLRHRADLVADQHGAGRDGLVHQPGVQDGPGDHDVRPLQRGRDLAAAGGAQPQPAYGHPVGQHVRDPEPGQLVQGVRGDPVPAALVAREVGAVEQEHPRAGAGAQRRQRRRRPRGAGADDRHVPDRCAHLPSLPEPPGSGSPG